MKKYNFIVTKPAGMTLIELLVVISILGLLTVVVIPALSGNRENNANRNAAQQVSGLISQSRNDAISAGRWAGVTVLAAGNGLDIARCRVPPPYRGDLDPSTVEFFLGPPRVRGTSAAALLRMLNANVAVEDFITFQGQPQRYRIDSTPTQDSSLRYRFNIAPVGPPLTTPWPPTNMGLRFAIERQPRVVGTTVTLSTESSIDMAHSGFDNLGVYTPFAAGQVSILFDERGTLRTFVEAGTRRIVSGPVFLLVGRVDRRGQSYVAAAGPSATDDTVGANWQYPTSYWIAIDPVSGQTRIAECRTGFTSPEDSQEYVREGLISQGL